MGTAMGNGERRPIRHRPDHYLIRTRDCSRMNCCTYQGPPVPRPVEPLAFQPPNGLMPGHAPVVAPERRFA